MITFLEVIKMGNDIDTICYNGGMCFICKKNHATECHHLIPKVSCNPFNEFIGICSNCHGLIHSLSRDARHTELTKIGQERARALGKPIGKRGKDKKPRQKLGYYKRWASKYMRKKYPQYFNQKSGVVI